MVLSMSQSKTGQQHYHRARKVSSVIRLDSFYTVEGATSNLKIPTFAETIAAMSGAIIVVVLSENPVAVNGLKQFIAVNGFTKSVI